MMLIRFASILVLAVFSCSSMMSAEEPAHDFNIPVLTPRPVKEIMDLSGTWSFNPALPDDFMEIGDGLRLRWGLRGGMLFEL